MRGELNYVKYIRVVDNFSLWSDFTGQIFTGELSSMNLVVALRQGVLLVLKTMFSIMTFFLQIVEKIFTDFADNTILYF